MSNINEGHNYLKLDNNDVKKYFDNIDEVLKSFELINDRLENKKGIIHDEFVVDFVIAKYLKNIKNSLNALKYKHMYQEKVTFSLKINNISGFPNFQEVIQLEMDEKEAENKLAQMMPLDNMKQILFDRILKYKKIPTDVQHEICKKHYYESLLNKELMKKFMPIEVFDKEKYGLKNDFIYWATYDSQKNHPIIYLVKYEYSDEIDINEISDYLKNISFSENLLMTIAMKLDKEFPSFHPKSIQRINIGPFLHDSFVQLNNPIYTKLFTGHNDWIFAMQIETLISKEQVEIKKKNVFERIASKNNEVEEIFFVDKTSRECVKHGLSSLIKEGIMTNSIYQRFHDMKIKETFGFDSIYIVDDDFKHIILD
jgi:hypothetical protein